MSDTSPENTDLAESTKTAEAQTPPGLDTVGEAEQPDLPDLEMPEPAGTGPDRVSEQPVDGAVAADGAGSRSASPAVDHLERTSSTGAASDGDVIGASQPGEASTTVKDPSDWVTGDEPMTGAQRSYLDTLARAAGEQLPADLTKAQASEHIDRLQSTTGRGSSS